MGPQFMAPEQLQYENSHHYDEKVDIYALGMCIIEMITRTYPYIECKSLMEVIKCISTNRDCLAFKQISSVSCSSFIQLLCDKNPQNRPSAHELIKHPFLCRNSPENSKFTSELCRKLEINV